MQVRELMTPDVQLLSANNTIRDAARQMRDQDIGSLPVADGDRLVGYITDRDIVVRALAEDRGSDTPVRQVMTERVLYCFEDDSVEDVAANMADNQVRRLPVLNRDKRLVGIVALADLATGADMDEPPKTRWRVFRARPAKVGRSPPAPRLRGARRLARAASGGAASDVRG
jgi:CBS domain-containing protein